MAAEANVFVNAVILLGGATVAAPLFKKLGLGTVLGYLCLGIILGPVLNYIHDGAEILHVAEIGVVLLLFLVGLELEPSRLWGMRREIFGLGGAQVVLSGIALSAFVWIAYFNWAAALVVGFGLALSSTAFALQMLEESGEEQTPHGKRAFSVLLFQDLAIAPLLIAVSLLAAGSISLTSDSLVSAGWAVGSLVALVLIGRYALNPLFGIIADTGAREAMIAAALFVVIGSAVLMQLAGLSMAMGAFIAGVMLAESSYRHQLQADIEPFRGILLGLFFIAVGLAVDLQIVWQNIGIILAFVPAAMAIKALVIYCLCRVFGSDHNDSIRVAFILPQHGEFGFVLFSAALGVNLLSPSEASILIACVTFSMALTPLCVKLSSLLLQEADDEVMDEDFEDAGADVLMIGFSRMGQIAAQALLAGGSEVTVLDNAPNRIRQAQRFGFRIYFGDGTRKDVLQSAGIKKAKIVAICTRERSVNDKIVELIAHEYPHLKLFVRSYDRIHALELLKRPGLWQVRETFESALVLGDALLQSTGHSAENASMIIDDVRRRDEARLNMQLKDGILAGRENLHSHPVPEPLIQPRKDGVALGAEAKEILEQ